MLRPVRPDEIDLVVELHAATATVAFAHLYGGQPFPMERTRERYRSFRGRIIVAEDAGAVIGFVAFEEGELSALYVLPDHWGRGVGASLLAAANPVSRLWVLAGNSRARSFYERHGWHADGASRDAFGVPELRYRNGGCQSGSSP
jgi:GNAT superfamily N-acetyltransferase